MHQWGKNIPIEHHKTIVSCVISATLVLAKFSHILLGGEKNKTNSGGKYGYLIGR